MVLETHMKLCMAEPDFHEKVGKMNQKRALNRGFWIYWSVVDIDNLNDGKKM